MKWKKKKINKYSRTKIIFRTTSACKAEFKYAPIRRTPSTATKERKFGIAIPDDAIVSKKAAIMAIKIFSSTRVKRINRRSVGTADCRFDKLSIIPLMLTLRKSRFCTGNKVLMPFGMTNAFTEAFTWTATARTSAKR